MHCNGDHGDGIPIDSLNNDNLSLIYRFEALVNKWLMTWGTVLKKRAKISLSGPLQKRVSPSDILQDTLLNAYANKDQFRGATSREFHCWMLSIFLNRLADCLRHHIKVKCRAIGQEEQPIADSADDYGQTPSAIARLNEDVGRLIESLQALNAKDQEVLFLRYWDGLDFKEIANRLNVCEGTIKYRWKRAIDLLAKRIDSPL